VRVSVGIIDYGMGNLHSVSKAFQSQGAGVVISDSPAKLRKNNLLVLPGVGAFGAAMRTLAKKRLDDFVHAWVSDGKPYVGICLGFQLLFERSEEDKETPGLGLFKGTVVRFDKKTLKKNPIPHMGWNTAPRSNPAAAPFFKGIKPKDYFYFVHSYYPVPLDPKMIASKTVYGSPFCSAIVNSHLLATQFHPEKSGQIGLRLVKNIVDWTRKRKSS